jgi:hypothetical protein
MVRTPSDDRMLANDQARLLGYAAPADAADGLTSVQPASWVTEQTGHMGDTLQCR